MRIRVASDKPSPKGVFLLSLRVALFECEAIGDLFDRIPVEVDLEFVHALGMVAGNRGLRDGVADIDHECSAGFPRNT
jgi:hypothetical protein